MLKSKTKFSLCGRITAIVILMSFLMTYSAHGEPPTMPLMSSEGSGTRLLAQFGEAEVPGKNAEHFYTEYEMDMLIEDLTVAAEEAIEKAAAEAAKAAALASLEREAAAMREAARQQAEALRWRGEAETVKRKGIKDAVLTGMICFLSGLAVGVGGVLIIGGR
jgi:hypothetical protein